MTNQRQARGVGFVGFLASLRVTLLLLVMLGIVCALATLVPVTESYTDFRRFLIGGVGRMLLKLGLNRPYESPLFRLLLFALFVNLCFCTIKRLPALFHSLMHPMIERNPEFYSDSEFTASIQLPEAADDTDTVSNCIEQGLGELGYSGLLQKEKAEGSFFFAVRHAYAPFGPHVTHLGVILLFVGGVLGWLYGVDGYGEAPKGGVFDVYKPAYYSLADEYRRLNFFREFYLDLEKEKALRSGDIEVYRTIGDRMDALEKKMDALKNDPLFSVRVLDATEEHYKEGPVKDWKSLLRVEKDGRAVFEQMIEVNTPLTFRGMSLFQHSFAFRPVDTDEITTTPGRPAGGVLLAEGGSSDVPGLPISLTIETYYPDFAVAAGADGVPRAFSRSDRDDNPALKVLLREKDSPPQSFFIFMKPPYVVHRSEDSPYDFRFSPLPAGAAGKRIFRINVFHRARRPWTGISIHYDPGTSLVWVGSLLLITGMGLSFFCEQRRCWISIDKHRRMSVVGRPSKFPGLYREEFSALVKALAAAVKGDVT